MDAAGVAPVEFTGPYQHLNKSLGLGYHHDVAAPHGQFATFQDTEQAETPDQLPNPREDRSSRTSKDQEVWITGTTTPWLVARRLLVLIREHSLSLFLAEATRPPSSPTPSTSYISTVQNVHQ